MRVDIEPAIMYFGTPVVLISTLHEDGTTNIAPISSVWWLGWSCMIGIDATSHTTKNLKRNGQCVLNLASGDLAEQVNALALLTGSKEIPLHKKILGYKSVKDKFVHSGLTPQTAPQTSDQDKENEKPSAIKECPIQLEVSVENFSHFGQNDERMAVPAYAIELKINKVSVMPRVLQDGSNNKIDPNKWNPLIMNFRKLYSLTSELNESRLARKPEALYAPWKQKGLKRLIGNFLLRRSNKRHSH